MKWWALVVLVVITGCPQPVLRRPLGDYTTHSVEQFLDAVERHDVETIAGALHTPLVYAGLWFSDPECTRQFPVPQQIRRDRVEAFARCLATLKMRASKRSDALMGVAVVDVDPGFEIEIAFKFVGRSAWITWIGYAGRRDVADVLPTVNAATLESLRSSGEPAPALDATARASLDEELRASGLPYHYAWLKICIDAEGSVTGVHAREVSSPRARELLVTAAQAWRFRPFIVGRQALPVCALERVAYPADRATDPEILPLASADATGTEIHMSPRAVKRITGERQIVPDEDDRLRIGEGLLVAALKVCFDGTGAITSVTTLEPSGLPGYDRKLERTVRGWRYQPVVIDGKPRDICTGVTFIYSQGSSWAARGPRAR